MKWWSELPGTQKSIVAAIALIALGFGAYASLHSRFIDQPEQIQAEVRSLAEWREAFENEEAEYREAVGQEIEAEAAAIQVQQMQTDRKVDRLLYDSEINSCRQRKLAAGQGRADALEFCMDSVPLPGGGP